MFSWLQDLVELATPYARSGVYIDEVASTVSFERGTDILDDVVCANRLAKKRWRSFGRETYRTGPR